MVERGSATRYRLLETIRQYARDRLVESGETDAIRNRHLAFFLDLSQRAEREMRGPEFTDWLQRLDADADNLRLAIDWGLESEPEAGIRMCVALWMLWRIRWGAELEGWFDRAVMAARELPPPPPEARLARDILVARVCSEAAFTQATWTNRDARALADEGLARARATGDLATISQGLAAAWTARLFAGRPEELLALGEESVEVAGRAGDPWTQAMAAASLAGALSIGRLRSADQDHARSLMEDATRYARTSGDGFAMAFVALIRGRIAGAAGRIAEARAAFQEAATFFDEIGDSRFGLVGLSDLGHAVRRGGELDEALSILRRTLPQWEHSGNRGAIANQLEAFGFIAVERGETDRAARLLGAAETLRELAGAAMLSYERAEYDAVVARLRASMAPTHSRRPGRRGGRCRSATRWPSRSRAEWLAGLAGKPANWYAGSMKITLDLDSDLYRAVKVEAARADRSVREVVAEALEGWLAAAEDGGGPRVGQPRRWRSTSEPAAVSGGAILATLAAETRATTAKARRRPARDVRSRRSLSIGVARAAATSAAPSDGDGAGRLDGDRAATGAGRTTSLDVSGGSQGRFRRRAEYLRRRHARCSPRGVVDEAPTAR